MVDWTSPGCQSRWVTGCQNFNIKHYGMHYERIRTSTVMQYLLNRKYKYILWLKIFYGFIFFYKNDIKVCCKGLKETLGFKVRGITRLCSEVWDVSSYTVRWWVWCKIWRVFTCRKMAPDIPLIPCPAVPSACKRQESPFSFYKCRWKEL